jgi:hypothetical protein
MYPNDRFEVNRSVYEVTSPGREPSDADPEISSTQISARPLQRFAKPHLLNPDAVSRDRAKAS